MAVSPPSYNVQISSDTARGIIVAVEVAQAGSDYGQLIPAVAKVERLDQRQDRAAAISSAWTNQGWDGGPVGLPDLQHSTVDPTALEGATATRGGVRRKPQGRGF